MPMLQELSLRDSPLLSNNRTAEERQWRYAQVAEQVFERLAKLGSNVQRIHFVPALYPEDNVAAPDANGHTWPCYSYEGGILCTYQERKVVKTVALPIPCSFTIKQWVCQVLRMTIQAATLNRLLPFQALRQRRSERL